MQVKLSSSAIPAQAKSMLKYWIIEISTARDTPCPLPYQQFVAFSSHDPYR